MKIEQVINLDTGDAARPSHMEDAFSLVGGYEFSEEERKPFGRIRGNAFTWKDVVAALAIVRRKAGDMRAHAEKTRMFEDDRVQQHWYEGVLATADLAERQAMQFVDDLQADLANARNESDAVLWLRDSSKKTLPAEASGR